MQFAGKKPIIRVVLFLAAFAGLGGGAVVSAAGAAAGRDLTTAEAGRAMRYVYDGKTRAALDYLDSLAVRCDGEPFYLLIKSRIAREALPIDDENKEQVSVDAVPIHEDLDRAIKACTNRMGEGEDDPQLLLYRGLAWMSKSHVDSFERRFWRAGRDAKKGKSDLEKYMKTHPDDPLARGTMGVFLYFADTIPSVFKYLSKLLFMPTGDREKGLRYITDAAARESVLQTDFQLVLFTVLFLFEGRYEDGLDGLVESLERYPNYPRLALPLALMQPFNPLGVEENARRIDDMLDRFDGKTQGEAEAYALSLLDYLNAHANRFFAPPDLVMIELNRIADTNPPHPDWIGGNAAFELGRLLASQGRMEDARQTFSWVGYNPRVTYLHKDAKRMTKSLRADTGAGPEGDFDPVWITDIYFGTTETRAEALRELESSSSTTAQILFYRAEALLVTGDAGGALAVYQDLFDAKLQPWDEEFKMLAASRVAEIHGARGEFDAAAEWMDRAMKYYSKEFLVDWVLEGRKRYYERLRDDADLGRPRIFTPSS